MELEKVAVKPQTNVPKKPIINAIDWVDLENIYLKKLTLSNDQIIAK